MKIRRRVLICLEFEHEEAKFGALVAAEMLRQHAEFISQAKGGIEQAGKQSFPGGGHLYWQAGEAEPLNAIKRAS